MARSLLVVCLAVIGALLHLDVAAVTLPAPEQQPKPGSEIFTIVKTRFFEVDEAFHSTLVKSKWLSKAELEALEDKPSADRALFALLAKEKPFLIGKEVNIDPDREGVLLAATKPMNFLPAPSQLRLGNKGPQTIHEGVTLSAQVHITADRRYVRAKFIEKSLEIEGVEQVKVVVDFKKGTEAVGELVFAQEASNSQTRYIPDGGKILLPLQSRPRAVKKNDRWLVAEITPRIYIEEEERIRRGKGLK